MRDGIAFKYHLLVHTFFVRMAGPCPETALVAGQVGNDVPAKTFVVAVRYVLPVSANGCTRLRFYSHGRGGAPTSAC